jgi:hypothetical protein
MRSQLQASDMRRLASPYLSVCLRVTTGRAGERIFMKFGIAHLKFSHWGLYGAVDCCAVTSCRWVPAFQMSSVLKFEASCSPEMFVVILKWALRQNQRHLALLRCVDRFGWSQTTVEVTVTVVQSRFDSRDGFPNLRYQTPNGGVIVAGIRGVDIDFGICSVSWCLQSSEPDITFWSYCPLSA